MKKSIIGIYFFMLNMMNAMELEPIYHQYEKEMLYNSSEKKQEKSLQDVFQNEPFEYYWGNYKEEKGFWVNVERRNIKIIKSVFDSYTKRFFTINPSEIVVLHLDKNKLTKTFFKQLFDSMPHLRFLDLQRNRIKTITQEDLQSIPSSNWLNGDNVEIFLRGNKIKTIDVPQNFCENGVTLHLENNYLTDKEIRKIKTVIQQKSSLFSSGPPTIHFGKQRSITQ